MDARHSAIGGIRAICARCQGAGWVETGDDPVALPDIVMTPGGYPAWMLRTAARSEAGAAGAVGAA